MLLSYTLLDERQSITAQVYAAGRTAVPNKCFRFYKSAAFSFLLNIYLFVFKECRAVQQKYGKSQIDGAWVWDPLAK